MVLWDGQEWTSFIAGKRLCAENHTRERGEGTDWKRPAFSGRMVQRVGERTEQQMTLWSSSSSSSSIVSSLRVQQSVSKLQVTQPICSLKCNITLRVYTLGFFCVVRCPSTVSHHTVNKRSRPYVSVPAARCVCPPHSVLSHAYYGWLSP